MHRIVQLLRSLNYVPIVDPIYKQYVKDVYLSTNAFHWKKLKNIQIFTKRINNNHHRCAIIITSHYPQNPPSYQVFVFDTNHRKTDDPRFTMDCRVDFIHSMDLVNLALNPKKSGSNPFKIVKFESKAFNYYEYLLNYLL